MMMHNLNLSIPKPCSEKWENFTPASNGAHCSTCSKVVVDFTNMSDEDIFRYFSTNNARTCGRFRSDQLKNYVLAPPPQLRPGLTLMKAGLVGLLLLFLNKETHAQTNERKHKTEITTNQTPAALQDTTIEAANFRGVVTSREDGSTLAGINVILKGSAVGTVTDAAGRFEFPQKVKPNDVLIFTFIGLNTKELMITDQTKLGTEIAMEMCMDMTTLGEVAVSGVYEVKQSGLSRLWSSIKSAF